MVENWFLDFFSKLEFVSRVYETQLFKLSANHWFFSRYEMRHCSGERLSIPALGHNSGAGHRLATRVIDTRRLVIACLECKSARRRLYLFAQLLLTVMCHSFPTSKGIGCERDLTCRCLDVIDRTEDVRTRFEENVFQVNLFNRKRITQRRVHLRRRTTGRWRAAGEVKQAGGPFPNLSWRIW